MPENVAPVAERHVPLDYSLLDQVDDAVQLLAVTPLSPKSQRLKEFETLVAAQKAEHLCMVEKAKAHINKAQAEASAALQERDQARAQRPAVPVPPPGPTQPVPSRLCLWVFGNPQLVTPALVNTPHHPPPVTPPVQESTF